MHFNTPPNANPVYSPSPCFFSLPSLPLYLCLLLHFLHSFLRSIIHPSIRRHSRMSYQEKGDKGTGETTRALAMNYQRTSTHPPAESSLLPQESIETYLTASLAAPLNNISNRKCPTVHDLTMKTFPLRFNSEPWLLSQETTGSCRLDSIHPHKLTFLLTKKRMPETCLPMDYYILLHPYPRHIFRFR